jgi:hypothetical protein
MDWVWVVSWARCVVLTLSGKEESSFSEEKEAKRLLFLRRFSFGRIADAVRADFATLDTLPAAALALFGRDGIFSTEAWYRATAAYAIPPGACSAFLVVSRETRPLAVFPLQQGPGKSISSLTTPYTCLWQPLFAPDLTGQELDLVCAAFLRCRGACPTLRLDALDPAHPFGSALAGAARRQHLAPLAFDHFGNWHEPLAESSTWDAYLAARPGALREAIRRKSQRLFKHHTAQFTMLKSPENLEHAIAAYEEVYAQSWKQPEPFPLFAAAFMREAARCGTLRLALLQLEGRPIAAQLWTVHSFTATLMKLAHRQENDALSPGTVLTALAIRHLLETHSLKELDFGRGDDEYKTLWTSRRRQRTGLVLANPRNWRGGMHALRHWAGKWRKKRRPGRKESCPFSEEKEPKRL